MKKKVKTIDILSQKKSTLNRLKVEADMAIGIVTSTISNLELINQEYDDTVAEIDNYMAQLAETRESMNKNRKYNTAIIANFSKLLEVNEE